MVKASAKNGSVPCIDRQVYTYTMHKFMFDLRYLFGWSMVSGILKGMLKFGFQKTGTCHCVNVWRGLWLYSFICMFIYSAFINILNDDGWLNFGHHGLLAMPYGFVRIFFLFFSFFFFFRRQGFRMITFDRQAGPLQNFNRSRPQEPDSVLKINTKQTFQDPNSWGRG